MRVFWFLISIFILSGSCTREESSIDFLEEDLNLGGETSIDGAYVSIFEQPASNLSASELDFHREGDKAFGDQFVTAPAQINSGLGPLFNKNSCESCHISNGRSVFPDHSNDLRGLLFRLSMAGEGPHGEPKPVPAFGGQLHTNSVFGIQSEASVSWSFKQKIVDYLDNTSVDLTQPIFSLQNFYTTFPSNALVSPRMAPAVIGLGLLEAIDEGDIRSLEDPDDLNGDGISGRANVVWDVQNQKMTLGRFGWKASAPNLLQQTAGAYHQDMGVTSPLFITENCEGQIQCDQLNDDPEISIETLKAAAFYTQSLAVPTRRNTRNPDVIAGKLLFRKLSCDQCHRASFITAQHPEFNFLSNQKIFPYTDLLLHDMGEELADNRPDFKANGREWRTAPLWGIGLTKTVGGPQSHFLHDGRARTLEEAILWHGGEAAAARDAFVNLNKKERQSLIKFLESL